MKLGSLFDGSGGFPLAGSLCGIEPVWASEVEPYPIAVTKSRFPNMKHLGSVTDINGGDIEPVDIITFGSPCQDLSVAGKRAGLKHEANGDEETTRSGLFMEAVRIIKEMRKATNGEYPTFAVWENVPGAFSSNKGEDFRTVLEELIKIVEPTAVMPAVPKNGWPYADSYCGDGWSLAYRVFDAQYWGVPQRRRRIYLVLDLRGQRAGKVSFEREGLRGNFATFKTAGQGTAGDAADRSGADDCEGIGINGEVAATLDASYYKGCGMRQGIEREVVVQPVAYLAREYKAPHLVSYPENAIQYIVRRLTPTECARLQGFPDDWGHPDHKENFTDEEYRFWLNVRNTHAAINGKLQKDSTKAQMLTWYNKLHTDSSEYKMWGNGISLPTALYVMQGIAEALKGGAKCPERKLSS